MALPNLVAPDPAVEAPVAPAEKPAPKTNVVDGTSHLAVGKTMAFHLVVIDQYGVPMAPQPTKFDKAPVWTDSDPGIASFVNVADSLSITMTGVAEGTVELSVDFALNGTEYKASHELEVYVPVVDGGTLIVPLNKVHKDHKDPKDLKDPKKTS